jgi:type I restriction enzyme S subunit
VSWPLVKLKDCCQVIGGATPKRNVDEYWNSSDVPWVTPKDISKLNSPVLEDAPEYISYEGFKRCAAFMLPKGSVLVTSRAPIGNIAIAGRDLCTNQGFKSLIPGEDVDGCYLYYCMLAYSINLQALGNGATFKEVSKRIVEDFKIPLPPLDEQKRIAAILDKADAIRRKRQQAINLTDDFLRSVFLDMFGDPVTNPKGWEIKDLKDIAKIQIGPFGTQLHKEDYIENGIPLINPTHIVKGNIVPKSNLTISDEKHASLPEYHLRIGDIIMGRRGEMGRCAIVNEKEGGWMCGTGSLFIRPNKSGVFSEYLNKLLSSQSIKNHLESESQGATMANLNKTIVGNIQIPVPSDEALEQFTLLKIKFLKLAKSSNVFRNKMLFDSLSQKAFAGEL